MPCSPMLASLDLRDFAVAEHCIARLTQQFPESRRVDVLCGMCAEAQGDSDGAKQIYSDVLKKDSANIVSVRAFLL